MRKEALDPGTKRDPEVLVVGAGPAGCAAAEAAARAGAHVLVVERKAVVGEPVRCGEYVPAPLVREVGRGGAYTVQEVSEMRTVLPSGEVHTLRARGFIIRRNRFDQVLAERALEAGARMLLSTRARPGPGGALVLRGVRGGSQEVRPKVVIGADGPRSAVGRWHGLPNCGCIPAVQVRVPLPGALEHTEVYFRPEIYGGYGWLFPRGKEANVGLGLVPRHGGPSLRAALSSFLESLAGQGRIRNRPSRLTAGWIPTRPLPRTVKGSTVLVGDAAGQTHPVTGAGVTQAVLCGRMAGKWAARAVLEGNLDVLSGYETEWRDMFGESLARAREKRKMLEQGWDRLEETLRSCWVGFREYYA